MPKRHLVRIPNTPGYLYLCGIRFSSSVTLWVDFVLIFSVLTFSFNATPMTLGYAAALYGIPPLLLGPLFGAIADRTNTYKYIFWSFFARCIVACFLFAATSQTEFLFFVFLKGASNLGSGSAEIILTRKLLSSRDLVHNISITTIMDQCVKICSPLAAGLIAAMTVKSAGFIVSGLFSLAGMMCLILLFSKHASSSTHTPEVRTFGSVEAFRIFFASGPSTRLFFLCVLVQSAVLGSYDSLLSLLLKESGFDSTVFGLIVSATALGGIIAGFIFPRVYPSRIALCTTLSLLAFGLAIVVVGMTPRTPALSSLWLLMSLFFIAGIAYGLTSQGFAITMQKYCALSHLGSVSATVRSLTLSLMIVAPILGAWLVDFLSVSGVLIFSGLVATLACCALHLKYRKHYVVQEPDIPAN